MNADVKKYNNRFETEERAICDFLANEIDANLKEAENKIWHAHPVWFLNGNPVVSYSKLKDCIRLLFWSGWSFEEEALQKVGGFMTAGVRYTFVNQIKKAQLKRWLKKARDILRDYKTL